MFNLNLLLLLIYIYICFIFDYFKQYILLSFV